jgi:hypothetical protein
LPRATLRLIAYILAGANRELLGCGLLSVEVLPQSCRRVAPRAGSVLGQVTLCVGGAFGSPCTPALLRGRLQLRVAAKSERRLAETLKVGEVPAVRQHGPTRATVGQSQLEFSDRQ